MTDEIPETAAPLRVFTCYDPRHDDRSCYLLVEDAEEPRRKHREWHAAEIAVRDGQRKAIKDRDEEIAALRAQIAGYGRDVKAYEGQVERVKTPAQHVPLEIDRSGYTDAELDEEPEIPEWARDAIAPLPEPDAEDEGAGSAGSVPEGDPGVFESAHDYPTGKTSAFGSVLRDF